MEAIGYFATFGPMERSALAMPSPLPAAFRLSLASILSSTQLGCPVALQQIHKLELSKTQRVNF